MLYKIINMSDPYTIEANSLDVAVIACVLLGGGQYAFDPLEDGGTKIPMFAFGGTDEWCKEQFGKTLAEVDEIVRRDKLAELADCFDSCLIGSLGERELFFDAIKPITDPKERHDYWFKYHDKRRSSMNDIGGRAKALAKRMRDNTAPVPDPVPQQVFVR
jgi:hypothetical protein